MPKVKRGTVIGVMSVLIGFVSGCGAGSGAPPSLGIPTVVPAPHASAFTVHEVTTGRSHSCALTLEGEVACWGQNTGGALGDGTHVNRHRPAWAQGVRFALDVDAGADHTCAQLEGGRVVCWGGERAGEAGSPVELRGSRVTLRQVAVGQRVCGLDYRGEALCWGDSLGDAPTPLSLGGAGQILDAGVQRVCVLMGPRRAQCYAYADLSRALPVHLEAATQLAVSGDHACVTGQGEVRCWGNNEHGQIGDGTLVAPAEPVRVELPDRATHVTTGWSHSCATTAPGAVFCWGNNDHGQLGTGSRESTASPVRVEGFNAPVIRVAAGMGHTCAVQADRRVFCWGDNEFGQVGVASRDDQLRPTEVSEPAPR